MVSSKKKKGERFYSTLKIEPSPFLIAYLGVLVKIEKV